MVIRQQNSYLPQLVRLSNARRDIRPFALFRRRRKGHSLLSRG
jgi:hypothetical protein